MKRAPIATGLALVVALVAPPTRAQPAPAAPAPWQATPAAPPSPGPTGAPPAGPEAEDPLVGAAARYLAERRPQAVEATLAAAVRRAGMDPTSDETLAVLLRLAHAMAAGGAALPAPAPAPSAPPAPPTNGPPGVSAPPPPPSDEEVNHRVVETAVALLARGQAAAAGAWLATMAGARANLHGDDPVPVLLRIAHAMADATESPGGILPGAVAVPRRPPDGIDGVEEVVLYSMGALHGLNTGILLAVLIDPRDNGSSGVLLAMAGAGAGTLVSALVNRPNLRRGRVYAANAGMWLGFSAGLALGLDARTFFGRDFSAQAAVTAEWLGTALGIGAGLGAAMLTDAQPGSASWVLSGGIWGGTLGILLAAALPGADGRSVGPWWLAGEAVGVGATLATAQALHPTPAQTRWLDLGALGGLFLGALIPAGGSRVGSAGFVPSPVVMGLGTVAGGVLGFLLGAPAAPASPGSVTAATGRAAPPVQLGVVPLPRGGALVTLSL